MLPARELASAMPEHFRLLDTSNRLRTPPPFAVPAPQFRACKQDQEAGPLWPNWFAYLHCWAYCLPT